MSPLQRRVIAFAVAAVAVSATARAAGVEAYALDPVHTRVMFAVEHAGFSQALGTVSGSTGSLLFDPDDWGSARLDVSVPLTRLELGDAKWNAATLGASLLDAEKHPLARFVSSSVVPIKPPAASASWPSQTLDAGAVPEVVRPSNPLDESQRPRPMARVCGELTLRDVTRPLCMEVTFNALKRYPLPPFRRTAGFSATATLSRSEFGIDAWASVIGDRVELRIEAEATRDNAAADAFTTETEPASLPARNDPQDAPEQHHPAPDPDPDPDSQEAPLQTSLSTRGIEAAT